MTPIYRTNPAPMAGNAPLQPMTAEQAQFWELRRERAGKGKA